MDILFPKLLCQTLAQSPQREFARSERARENVSSDTSRGASENQRAPPAQLVDRVFLERQNHLAGEREGRVDVGLLNGFEVGFGHFKEALEHTGAAVPDGHTDFGLGGPDMLFDLLEVGGDVTVGVRGDRENCGLNQRC